ncbi:hypothetical protein Tco_0513820 [Tanacetum coccineum]
MTSLLVHDFTTSRLLHNFKTSSQLRDFTSPHYLYHNYLTLLGELGDESLSLGDGVLCGMMLIFGLLEVLEMEALVDAWMLIVVVPNYVRAFWAKIAETSSLLIETSDSSLEEFADELALLEPFLPGNEDDNFDPEDDIDIDIVDPILERFTDEPALVYSFPPGDDDDDLFDIKSDNEKWKKLLYGDPFNNTHSENEKDKDLKMECLIDDMDDDFSHFNPQVKFRLRGTDIAKITRERSKPDKHGHENRRAHKELEVFYKKVKKSTVVNPQSSVVIAKVSSNSSTPGISPDVAALTTEVSNLKNMMKTMLIDKQKSQALAPVKAVEQSCVTCGGAHSYRNCPSTDGNVYRDNIQEYVSQAATASFNQGNTNSRPPMVANQIRPPGQVYQPSTSQPPVYQAQPYQATAQQMQSVSKTDFENYVKANDAVLRNMQNQGQGLQNQMTNLTEMLSKFVNSNTASSSNSGSLSSNTVTNPKEDLKGITTQSGIVYQGLTIPTSSPKVVERRTEVKKDKRFFHNNGITEDVQPPVVPVEKQNPVFEPVDAPVRAPMPNPKPSIPYPSRRNDEKRRENTDEQKEKFYEIFKDMSFEISFVDALTIMPKFASTLKALNRNIEKLSEMSRTFERKKHIYFFYAQQSYLTST